MSAEDLAQMFYNAERAGDDEAAAGAYPGPGEEEFYEARRDCPFCEYSGPSEILGEALGCILIEPLNSVTPGHRLVVPREHAVSAAENPALAGKAFRAASMWARPLDGANLITSIGELATQTIKHLHVHIIPRRENDGLMLPWSRRNQLSEEGAPKK